MLEFNLEIESSLSTGVLEKISQFGADLSKLMNVLENVMFMFLVGVLTLTGLSTFT